MELGQGSGTDEAGGGAGIRGDGAEVFGRWSRDGNDDLVLTLYNLWLMNLICCITPVTLAYYNK